MYSNSRNHKRGTPPSRLRQRWCGGRDPLGLELPQQRCLGHWLGIPMAPWLGELGTPARRALPTAAVNRQHPGAMDGAECSAEPPGDLCPKPKPEGDFEHIDDTSGGVGQKSPHVAA